MVHGCGVTKAYQIKEKMVKIMSTHERYQAQHQVIPWGLLYRIVKMV